MPEIVKGAAMAQWRHLQFPPCFFFLGYIFIINKAITKVTFLQYSREGVRMDEFEIAKEEINA